MTNESKKITKMKIQAINTLRYFCCMFSFVVLIGVNYLYAQCYVNSDGFPTGDPSDSGGSSEEPVGTGWFWDNSGASGTLSAWIEGKIFTDCPVTISKQFNIAYNDTATNEYCGTPQICMQGGTCNGLFTTVWANNGTPQNLVRGIATALSNGSVKEISQVPEVIINNGEAFGNGRFDARHRNDPNNFSQWQKWKVRIGDGNFNFVEENDGDYVNTTESTLDNNEPAAIEFTCVDSEVGLDQPHLKCERAVNVFVNNTGYDLTWATVTVVVCATVHEGTCQVGCVPVH